MSMHSRYARQGGRAWVFAGLCSLLLAGCNPMRVLPGIDGERAVTAQPGLAYGDTARQRLDVYRPDRARAQSPVVIYFYGGSWKWGDRASYRFVGETLAGAGYVTVVPDYRVYPEVEFPAFVEDGAAALAWVAANIPQAEHGVILMGHSAGAHIAALLALDRDYTQSRGLDEGLVRGLVGLAGPYAFQPLEYESVRPVFAAAAEIDDARPVTFACDSAVPRLLMHGDDDTVVVPANSRSLHERSVDCGADSRLVSMAGVSHYGIVLGLSSLFQSRAPVVDPLLSFLDGLRSSSAGSIRTSSR